MFTFLFYLILYVYERKEKKKKKWNNNKTRIFEWKLTLDRVKTENARTVKLTFEYSLDNFTVKNGKNIR